MKKYFIFYLNHFFNLMMRKVISFSKILRIKCDESGFAGVLIVFVGILLRTMFMFTKFDVIWLVTGAGGIGCYTKTLPIHTYMKTFGELQVGAGAALSMMMFLMLVVFALIYFKLYKRDEHI